MDGCRPWSGSGNATRTVRESHKTGSRRECVGDMEVEKRTNVLTLARRGGDVGGGSAKRGDMSWWSRSTGGWESAV